MVENVGVFRRLWPLAVGCALGGTVSWRVHAAEWSIAPTMSWTVDHSSNRYLVVNSPPGEGAFVTLDALMSRTTDALELDMHPSIGVQRFSNNSASDTVNRSLTLGSTWNRESSKWIVGGTYSELSTLTTELASTGIVQGNTRQRQETGSVSWQWDQSENRHFTATGAYNDTAYIGEQAFLLPGYRYPTASLAERFTLSDVNAITVSASGGDLRSGGSISASPNTQDEQLTLSLDHSFSERFTLFVSAGVNDRSSSGRKAGYVGEFLLKRLDERNQWKLEVSRTVDASGFGVLSQHTAGSVSFTRDLAYPLSAGLSLTASQDKQDVTSGPLLEQTRTYEAADATLNWLSGETSTVSLGTGYARATISSEPPTPLGHGWHASITYRWTPRPTRFSR